MTTSQLEEFRLLVGNLLSVVEIAIVLEIVPEDLQDEIEDKDSEISKVYHRELLLNKSSYNTELLTNAKLGNEAAIKEFSVVNKQRIINDVFGL